MCINSIWFVPPGWLTFHLNDGLFISNVHHECCTVSTHCVACVTCPHSEHTGWAQWCRPTLSAGREAACTGRVPRNCWQTASPSPGAAQQHKHTHSQVSVTAHAGGVLSVALWDILVTVIAVTLSLPTETPNTHSHCSHSRFLLLQSNFLIQK